MMDRAREYLKEFSFGEVFRFNFAHLKGDLMGGFTSAVVALPLALGFGILAYGGDPRGAVAGLYGAIFTGFLASLFGGTPRQITGPTGGMTVILTMVYKDLGGSYPTVYLRAYIYVDSYDTKDDYTSIMMGLGAGTTNNVFLGLRDQPSGSPPSWPLWVWYGGKAYDTGVRIAADTWYSVELASYRDNTQGWVRVWVNNGDANNPNFVRTGINTGTADFSRVRVGFKGAGAYAATVAYFDAVVVAESFIDPLP